MIQPEEIQQILNKSMPSAEITVQDLTGSRDHYQVIIIWEGFQGKNLVQQHQIVNKILEPALEDGRIHALSMKTFAPA